MRIFKLGLILALTVPLSLWAAEGEATFPDNKFEGNMHNQESVMNGAKYFMNYCSGCHSLKYQRYNRLAEDMGMDKKQVEQNLIFDGSKFAETIETSMSAENGIQWFGKLPPDLSVIVRAKGGDYIYNYLLGFYSDPTKATGTNNSVFPGVGMPAVLSGLEGIKEPVYNSEHAVVDFKVIKAGTMSTAEYKSVAYDLTNFLYYVSDPSKLKRDDLGWKVLLFLVILTIFFYFLNKEYWRDVEH